MQNIGKQIMSMINVEQQRAYHAWEVISKVKSSERPELKKSLQSLGTSIRTIGFSRALAVLYRDGKDKPGVQRLLQEVARFVLETRLQQPAEDWGDAKQAIERLLAVAGDGTTQHYRYWEIHEETLAFVEHLKAFATAPSTVSH